MKMWYNKENGGMFYDNFSFGISSQATAFVTYLR